MPLDDAASGSIANDLRHLLGSLAVFPLVALLFAPGEAEGFEPPWAVAAVFSAWLVLTLGARRENGISKMALGVWRRLDPLIAAALIYATLFRRPESLGVPLALFVAIAVFLALLRRASGPVLLTVSIALLGVLVVLPRAFRAALVADIASTFEHGVDHRLRPDGDEINSDGARFRGEASELAAADFVVLFLGDSFTFGYELAYDDSYPYRFERIAAEAGCADRIRVVNFGWTSASPLLALRLLREKGYRYRPDLVLYNLDMTDFHDDLRYEKRLRKREDFEIDTTTALVRLIDTRFAWASPGVPALRALAGRLRSRAGDDREALLADLEVPDREDRFFVTAHPLSVSRPAIELGVMKNLAEMHAFAKDVLDARLAVVVYPRAYQYSELESPRNWEDREYRRLGPHAKEPFRYFDEMAPSLPYPVVSLLSAFEESPEFPLFFESDPHWNEAGADQAARAAFAELDALGWLPCPAS